MNHFDLTELPHSAKVSLLESSPWAHDLSPVQISKLAEYFDYYSIPAGVTVMQEGESNQFFCLICEGAVNIFKENTANESKFLQKFGRGKTFGEMSFFDGTPCSATVITNDVVNLLSINKSAFKKLCEESPAIALQLTLNLMSHISQRLRQTTGKLIDLM